MHAFNFLFIKTDLNFLNLKNLKKKLKIKKL